MGFKPDILIEIHIPLYAIFIIPAVPYFTIPLKNQHMDLGADLQWRCIARGIPEVSTKLSILLHPNFPPPIQMDMGEDYIASQQVGKASVNLRA